MKKETGKPGDIFDSKIIKQLWLYLKPYRVRFYLLIIMTVFLAILGPIRPKLVQMTIDDYIFKADVKGMLILIAIIVATIIAQAIVEYFHSFSAGFIGQNVVKDLRTKLYAHMMKFKVGFFDHTPVGRLITRNVSDLETVADIFSEGVAAIAGDLLQIVAIMALMFYTDWKLTLVSLSLIPFLFLATYIFKEKIKGSFNETRLAVSNLNTFVQEHISGMAIVQIFNAQKTEHEKFMSINTEHKEANIKSIWYYSVYFPVAEVLAAASTGLLVWYGAGLVLGQQATVGVLVSFIMYIALFFRPIRMIADRFNTLQMGVISAERVFALLNSTEHIEQSGTLTKKIEGHVKFEQVSFSYNTEKQVLKDVSFEVKKGQMAAFVGPTGAGKTSIINLLNRFYEFQEGGIFLDQTDIRDFDLNHLRKSIGVVQQDVFLFSGSIYENVTLGDSKISREKVWDVAKQVGADGFISQLRNGIDQNVMERGATLSVGQRQLLSFMRVLVHDPQILLLDEATSSVDSETEELIKLATNQAMKGRTSLVIAHRLSTIEMADVIFVIEEGRIKEQGSHQSLLAENGLYSKLYNMQYKLLNV